MAHVRVVWARSGDTPRVRICYPNGLDEVVPESELLQALPHKSTVHSYYRDGPYLLSRLVAARDLGYINRVVLRPYMYSHPFVRTEIVGIHAITAKLWATRDAEVLISHPVFTRLAPYIPHGSAGALANLLTLIFDPRWYCDPHRPDRWSKIEQAFALSPRSDKRADCPRRSIIRACWIDAGPPAPDNLPVDYFGRHHAKLLATGMADGKAVRKTGRLFIRAAVSAWLEAENGGDAIFDPSRLFDTAASSEV